jgi:hypothetical protein
MAAYNRSVPTAICGGIPKSRRRGVINEPPPMPVIPTTSPTRAPDIAYNRKSMNIVYAYNIQFKKLAGKSIDFDLFWKRIFTYIFITN